MQRAVWRNDGSHSAESVVKNRPENDTVRMEALKNSDEKAYAWIYNKYDHQLRSYAQTFVTRTEAEDIIQDVFSKQWEDIEQLKTIESVLSPYLYTCVRNRCKNLLISSWRKNTQSIEDKKEFQETEIYDPFFRFETEEERKIIKKTVKRAVKNLPDIYREVIILRYYKGIRNNEIAKLLEITVEAVESRIRRARNTLKKALEPLIDKAFIIF